MHAVLVGLGGKDGEQIQDVEQQLAVEGRQFSDQLLVCLDSPCHVGGGLLVYLTNDGLEGCAEAAVEFERDDWLRELI